MKLPIKKEYFDAIKHGIKTVEYRDAHITFVCEKTGRTLRKNVVGVELIDIAEIGDLLDVFDSEMFEDEIIIKFTLAD